MAIARSTIVGQPEPAALGLLMGDLQPLALPDPLDPLVVDCPARLAQELGGLAIGVARKLKAIDVIDVLSDLFTLRGVPAHIRFDNGPELVASLPLVVSYELETKTRTANAAAGGPGGDRQVRLIEAKGPSSATSS
jgi:hypothetical protein